MTAASQSNPAALIARIALPVPVPRTFDYLTAGSILSPGCRVRVPFGRTRRVGVVVDIVPDADVEAERLKPIEAVLDDRPLLDPELLSNLRRAADYWCGAIGEVIFGALPLGLRDGRAPSDFAEEAWR
ncbi:MAG TPA: hypothetical protein VFW60_02935, partial [Rhodanobacteraceae bacterium]|nr:hypothetical protein [Rhodanobacteraceae bacterium]